MALRATLLKLACIGCTLRFPATWIGRRGMRRNDTQQRCKDDRSAVRAAGWPNDFEFGNTREFIRRRFYGSSLYAGNRNQGLVELELAPLCGIAGDRCAIRRNPRAVAPGNADRR